MKGSVFFLFTERERDRKKIKRQRRHYFSQVTSPFVDFLLFLCIFISLFWRKWKNHPLITRDESCPPTCGPMLVMVLDCGLSTVTTHMSFWLVGLSISSVSRLCLKDPQMGDDTRTSDGWGGSLEQVWVLAT